MSLNFHKKSNKLQEYLKALAGLPEDPLVICRSRLTGKRQPLGL